MLKRIASPWRLAVGFLGVFQEHVRIVGLFIGSGIPEVHRDHPVPKR
jgi:hypothetical protein